MTIQHAAAQWRTTNGNQTSKKEIKTGRTKFDRQQLIDEIIRQSDLSERRKKSREVPTTREYCQQLIVKRLRKIAGWLPEQSYSMGSLYKVKCGPFTGEKDTREHYAKSSKYKAKHGYVEISFTPEQIRQMRYIGGLITIKGPKVAPGIYEAQWIETKGMKHRYELFWQEGYLTKSYHAASIKIAQTWREKELEYLLRQRKDEAAAKARKELVEQAQYLFYGYQHSIDAGNCRQGTMNFIQSAGLNASYGYRGDYLLQQADKLGVRLFVERMIERRIK